MAEVDTALRAVLNLSDRPAAAETGCPAGLSTSLRKGPVACRGRVQRLIGVRAFDLF